MRIRKFLELAHEQWQTDKPRHNITLGPNGDDLDVTIFSGGLWHSFYATEDEFEKPAELIAQMATHIDRALAGQQGTP